jgi:hypothetical protein
MARYTIGTQTALAGKLQAAINDSIACWHDIAFLKLIMDNIVTASPTAATYEQLEIAFGLTPTETQGEVGQAVYTLVVNVNANGFLNATVAHMTFIKSMG